MAENPDDQPERIRFEEFERILGAKIRHLREERGWSQSDLARRLSELGLDLHQTTIAKMEAGRRPLRVSEAVAVAQAFKLPANALFWLPVPGEPFRLAEAREDLARSEKWTSELEETMLESIRIYAGTYASNIFHIRELTDLIERSARIESAPESERPAMSKALLEHLGDDDA